MRLPTQLFAGLKPRPEKLVDGGGPQQHHPWKPAGGIWTSTYRDGTSGWVEWCRDESFNVDRVSRRRQWLLDPLDVRVRQVDSGEAVKTLFDEYGVDYREAILGGEKLPELVPTFAPEPHFNYWTLDWVRFAEDYDALWLADPWLTVDGLPLRLASMMFYGFDCESTWWARWSFENVRRPDGR